MEKRITIALILLLTLGLAACGGTPTPEPTPTPVPATPTPTPVPATPTPSADAPQPGVWEGTFEGATENSNTITFEVDEAGNISNIHFTIPMNYVGDQFVEGTPESLNFRPDEVEIVDTGRAKLPPGEETVYEISGQFESGYSASGEVILYRWYGETNYIDVNQGFSQASYDWVAAPEGSE